MSSLNMHHVRCAVGLGAAVTAIAVTPFMLPDPTLSLITMCGVLAIGAMGLNVLSGNAGQVSLAVPFYVGVGAYITAWMGVEREFSLTVILVVAVVVGCLLGAASGLLVVSMRGPQLAIVTLGIMVFGTYVFTTWVSVTGGESGTSTSFPLTLGPVDLEDLGSLTTAQTLTWFVWGLVLMTACLTSSMLGRGHGRALHAIRVADRTAEAIGIDIRAYKLKATTFAGGMGALCGVLYAVVQGYVTAFDFDVYLTLLLIAMIVVGGLGRVAGAIVGAAIVWGMQYVVTEQASAGLSWLLKTSPNDDGLISVSAFNTLVYGGLIVGVLVINPAGVAGVWSQGLARAGKRLPRRAVDQRIGVGLE